MFLAVYFFGFGVFFFVYDKKKFKEFLHELKCSNEFIITPIMFVAV